MKIKTTLSRRNGIPNSHKVDRLVRRKILNNICPTCNGRLIKDLNTHGVTRHWVCASCNHLYSI